MQSGLGVKAARVAIVVALTAGSVTAAASAMLITHLLGAPRAVAGEGDLQVVEEPFVEDLDGAAQGFR